MAILRLPSWTSRSRPTSRSSRIWEVILPAGREPFMLSPPRGRAGASLESIPHVKVIRWPCADAE